MRLIRPVALAKPLSRVFGRMAEPVNEQPAVTSNPYCRSCLEHATNCGTCNGAGGDGRPSYQVPPCWTEFPTRPASTDDDGCMLDLETFMQRVLAICQRSHDQAVALIGRETVLDVLTQARDVCPGDRLLALNRRVRELCQAPAAASV